MPCVTELVVGKLANSLGISTYDANGGHRRNLAVRRRIACVPKSTWLQPLLKIDNGSHQDVPCRNKGMKLSASS